MRVLSWGSLPVWASGRQTMPGSLRYRQRGGQRGPAFRFGVCALWLRRDAARRLGRPASQQTASPLGTPTACIAATCSLQKRPPRTGPGLPGAL